VCTSNLVKGACADSAFRAQYPKKFELGIGQDTEGVCPLRLVVTAAEDGVNLTYRSSVESEMRDRRVLCTPLSRG